MASACTIVEKLSEVARRSPHAVAYRLLGDGEAETGSVTWAGLDRQVRSVSADVARHCARGDRVILLVSPCLEFVPAFLGVLHAGCVAVPVAPPGAAAASGEALRRILTDAQATLVLTDLPGDGLADSVTVRSLGDALRAEPTAQGPAPAGEDLAFLQYTSGSTGDPKGVMVTHANLMANEAQIAAVFGTTADDVVVSWLPFYHDMGLIGAVLQPLYAGATAVLMPPTAFLRRPLRWLGAISRYRGTISPAPDFAYHLCAQTAAADGLPPGLDLRSWRVACNGSEPVRPATLRRFTETFAAAGFDGAAFAPSYGMAEATLLVTGVGPGRAPRVVPFDRGDGHPVDVVSCGPCSVEEVVVVRAGTRADDGVEGDILVRGPNVAAGYWQRPDRTAETFGCRAGAHTYLRTGDLGFVRDGELFVTGRGTDLIIVRGRNHHPNDIEATVQGVGPGLPAGVGAVFTDGDDLVLVQAVRAGADVGRLTDAIRSAVTAVHGLHLDRVLLVPPRAVPRTTSGKVRRAECRRRYLAGDLPVLTAAAAPAATGDALDPLVAGAVAAVLDCPPSQVRADVPLTAAGLDSLRALRLQEELAGRAGAEVPLSVLLDGATPASLAAYLAAAPVAAPAAPVPDDGEAPAGAMSVGQRALAFLSAADPRGAADYTIARSVLMPEGLPPDGFARAVAAVVARHPALRSRFTGEPGAQTLSVRDPAEADWCPVHHLHTPGEVEARTRRLLVTPLDLAADPLFECTVLTAPGVPAVLVLRVCHLVADLHSVARVMDEVLRVCRGAPLPPVPAAFAEVVREEAAYLRAPGTTALAAALADGLRDLPDVRWPVAAPRSGAETPGAAVTIALAAPATAALHALAEAERTTLFAVLLGLYGLFLTRLSGNDTVAVGVPFAAREGGRRRGAVGYLVNTLPMRLHLPPGTTPAEAARAAKRALLDGMDAARVPLAVVVQHLRRTRTAASAPFPALFDLLDDPVPGVTGLGAAGLDLPGGAVIAGGQRFPAYLAGTPRPLADLDVAFTTAGDGLLGRFAYDGRVFDTDTGALLADLFIGLIHRAAAAPHEPVGWPGPDAVGEAAAARRTVSPDQAVTVHGRPWSVLPPPDPAEPARPLGALFAEQVRQRPDAEAVVQHGDSWTYARLAAAAAGAAALLPEVPISAAVRTPLVGLCFVDPVRFLVAMLAAWSRGYGVVPLPADFPDERLAYMMDDCDLGAIFTAEHTERLTRLAGPSRPVIVPPAGNEIGAVVGEPEHGRGADDVVYVVYTSGTTGRPKGVPITSAQVLPLLRWQVEGLGARAGMRLAQTLALSFDFGLQELMTTVLFGGTLCVPQPAERYAPDAFGAFLRRDRVDTLFATPSFLRGLVAHGVALDGLRLLVLGGEMLTAAAVRDALPLLGPDTGVINGYGPTEASINCTMHVVDRARVTGTDGGAPAEGVLPVGAATGRSQVYVLDGRGDVLPAGLAGEVYIGGPGVAGGYLNLPEETAARFLPDTVTGGDGAVMYRTGDIGLVTGGELVLLGRLDHQVKIRGYRIELGEVEAVLRGCPGVEDAVALLDRGAEPARIVGVIVGTGCDPATARAELARRLPAYMVPGRIVRVAVLPRTAHGKLDEAALLHRSREQHSTGGHSGVRAAVAAAWQEQLGLDRVDPDANFFELGGHSLAVVPMLGAVADRLGVERLPLHTLFEHPTVRLLAEHVEQLLARQGAATPAVAAAVLGAGGAPPARPAGRHVRGRQRGLTDRSARPQGVSE